MQLFYADIGLSQVTVLHVGKRFTFIDEIGNEEAFAEDTNDGFILRSKLICRLTRVQYLAL